MLVSFESNKNIFTKMTAGVIFAFLPLALYNYIVTFCFDFCVLFFVFYFIFVVVLK